MPEWSVVWDFIKEYQLLGFIIGLLIAIIGYFAKRKIEKSNAHESVDLFAKITKFKHQSVKLFFAKKYLNKNLIELIKKDIDPLLIETFLGITYLAHDAYISLVTLDDYDIHLLNEKDYNECCEGYLSRFHSAYSFLKVIRAKGCNNQKELVDELNKIETFVTNVPKPKDSEIIDSWEEIYIKE